MAALEQVDSGPGLIGVLRDRLDAIADRWVAHIVAKNSAYLDTALVSLPDLRRSCRDTTDAVLRLLAGEAVGEPYAVIRTSARRQAERGVPLDSVLRSYRLAGLALWQELAECGTHTGTELLDVAS